MNVCGQAVLAAALVSRTKIEDEMMMNEFGEQWQEWAKKTRWRLLPGVY
jgi:protein-S-isoprenylcysteine O-methyltransferase Ste14